MKLNRPYFKSIIGAAGLLIATSGIIAASDEANAKVVSVTLNAGETYVIKNLGEDNTPAVHVLKNPNALIVHSEAPGELVLLGAAAGQWALDVKDAAGDPITYRVNIKAIANPTDQLTPGKAPAAMSDNGPESKAAAPGTTAALDTGSGPVESGSKVADAAKPAPVANGFVAGGAAPAPAAIETTKNVVAPATGSPLASNSTARGPSTAPAVPSSAPDAATSASPIRLAAYMAPTKATDAVAPSGTVIPSQAASTISQLPPQKFSSDPPATALTSPSEERPNGTNFLPVDVVELMAGNSQVFDFAHRIRRISVADTEVADIQVVNPYQINLIGHKEGFTTLAVWDNQGSYIQRQIRVDQFGKQQVLLNVIVAELNRGRMESQAINWNVAFPKWNFSLNGLGPGGAATPYTASSNLIAPTFIQNGSVTTALGGATGELLGPGLLTPFLLSPTVNYGIAAGNNNIQTQSLFNFLESHNLAKILAQPHMLANSGEKAEFLSGGEIPIVVAQALNTSIVFKQYGTSVIFVPTVVGKDDIEMEVKPEVSQPDFANGVSMFGFTVPAFVTRRAQTFVRLKNEQTLIIAGLILHTKTSGVDKTPYLGDLPVLGNLFKHTTYNDTNTDLVMSVTPQIVQPLPSNGRVADPVDRGPINQQEIQTERLAQPDASRPRF
jgi:pilus assembly protein CpaC